MTSETVGIKVARMEERVASMQKELTESLTSIIHRLDKIDANLDHNYAIFAKKTEVDRDLMEIKALATSRLWQASALTALLTLLGTLAFQYLWTNLVK